MKTKEGNGEMRALKGGGGRVVGFPSSVCFAVVNFQLAVWKGKMQSWDDHHDRLHHDRQQQTQEEKDTDAVVAGYRRLMHTCIDKLLAQVEPHGAETSRWKMIKVSVLAVPKQ